MGSLNQDDIEILLEKWAGAKEEITSLEKRIEKYKLVANKLMRKRNTTTLQSSLHKLNCKKMSRKTISKIDVPEAVWNTYAKSCSYSAYYLSEK